MVKKLVNLLQKAARLCVARNPSLEKKFEKYFMSGNR